MGTNNHMKSIITSITSGFVVNGIAVNGANALDIDNKMVNNMLSSTVSVAKLPSTSDITDGVDKIVGNIRKDWAFLDTIPEVKYEPEKWNQAIETMKNEFSKDKIEFSINDENNLLTTTTRGIAQSSEMIKRWVGSTDVVSVAPTFNSNDQYNDLRRFLYNLIDVKSYNIEVVAVVACIILAFDAFQTNNDLSKLLSDKNEELDELLRAEKDKAVGNANAELDVTIIKLRKQIQDMQNMINIKDSAQPATAAVVAPSTSSPAELNSLKQKYEEEFAALKYYSNGKIGNLESEVQRLKSELTASKASNNIDEVIKARDTKVLDALKVFLVENGHLPQGTANMLLMSTVPDTLKSLAPNAKGSAKVTTTDAEKKVKELSSYVKELNKENDFLKEKLLTSENKMWEIQQEMQSKLDSAKIVVKELNTKIQTQEKVTKEASTPPAKAVKEVKKVSKENVTKTAKAAAPVAKAVTKKAVAEKVAAVKPAAVKAAAVKPVAVKSAAKAAAVSVPTSNQLKKMAKSDIITLIQSLGKVKNVDSLKDKLKQELIEIVEK